MSRRIISDFDEWDESRPLSVIGPTGSGKTALVIDEVRRRYSSNPKHPLLISLDSIAAYCSLDIGSAKPSVLERNSFSWCGLDLFSLDEQITLIEFFRRVSPAILMALESSRPLIFVGGSHFYERAISEGVGLGAASDVAFQESLENMTNIAAHARLVSHDKRFQFRFSVNDRYRVFRALDLIERQGLTFEDLNRRKKIFPWDCIDTIIIGLDVSPVVFELRLKQRIEKMFIAGWEEEVRSILAQGYESSPALNSVGYLQLKEFITGVGGSIEETHQKILDKHKQLSKKQRTWLRGIKTQI